MGKTDNPQNSFMLSPYTAFTEPVINAYLYNPPIDKFTLTYLRKDEKETVNLDPALVCTGNGLPNNTYTFAYRIEGSHNTLDKGEVEVIVSHGWFETRITPKRKYPNAKKVSWKLSTQKNKSIQGDAPLSWSRFKGQVKYFDEKWRSSHIDMRPVTWGTPTNFTVPVSDDGYFDAQVPARVYAVLNINGTGYGYDAMERWAWDYDLTKDREETFTMGRTELYGMRAFDINGGPSTIFVIFRPTTLSRILRFDTDRNGFVEGEEKKQLEAAMKKSPTVIGPELTAKNVRVWLNGKEEKIVQFNQIPEYDGGHWQVQYLLQIFPNNKPPRGIWHEIKVETVSKEYLYGEAVIDFGQGSVGFYRP